MSDMLVPVSIGEVLDKITILKIKQAKIADPLKLKNVNAELSALEECISRNLGGRIQIVSDEFKELQKINLKLWDIEDKLRDFEREEEFGESFIRAARAVYFTNDERAAVKKRINETLGSRLIEEKSYQNYSSKTTRE